MYTYPYPRPAAAVDIVLFQKAESGLKVLLIQRKQAPFQDQFALPGGFLNPDETLEQAAARELTEETGLENQPLKQIHTFSDPDRDPRGRILSTAFAAVVDRESLSGLQPGSDAADAGWFPIDDLPELAFDHHLIIQRSFEHLSAAGRL